MNCERQGTPSTVVIITTPTSADLARVSGAGISRKCREMAASALARAGEKKSNVRRKELAAVAKRLRVIPHGVDPAFRPLALSEKQEARQQLFRGKVRDDDFLMVNVNTDQRRKGVPQSLQILAELKELREESDPEFGCTSTCCERTAMRALAWAWSRASSGLSRARTCSSVIRISSMGVRS